MNLAVIYALLAAIATFTNIGAQDLLLRIYAGQFCVPVSIAFGTLVGLVVKYVLDKRYIFRFQANSLVQDGRIFILYTFMGLVTTVIFWVFEFSFDYFFASKLMRYFGGILGLAIGYLSKYHLDKRFVFAPHVACKKSHPGDA